MDVTSLFLINKVTFYNVAPFFHSNEKYNISNCSSGYLVFSQAVVKLLYTSTHVQQINNWTQLLFTVPWGWAWSALSSPHKFTSRAKQKRSNRRDSGVKGCVRSSWQYHSPAASTLATLEILGIWCQSMQSAAKMFIQTTQKMLLGHQYWVITSLAENKHVINS